MTDKPTYEELEQRVEAFEREVVKGKRVEEALRESEERFRIVMEQSPWAIEIYDPDGKLLIVNDAWESFWNLKKSDVANFNILDDPECERTGLTSAFKEVLQGDIRIIPPEKYDPKDSGLTGGLIRWISSKMYPIKDQNDKIKNIVLVMEDITDHKLAGEALQKAHDELEQRVKERTAELEKMNEQLLQKIEERKQAERALQESEKKYCMMFEHAGFAITLIDAETGERIDFKVV